jgi:hypothetical protein
MMLTGKPLMTLLETPNQLKKRTAVFELTAMWKLVCIHLQI